MSIKSFFRDLFFDKQQFLLPKGTVVCGPFQAIGSGFADGRLKGDVNVGGKFVVGKNAEIKGDVTAKTIEVHGHVHGNILCTDKAFVNNTAIIKGNITAAVFEIKEGALIEGVITKTDDIAGKWQHNRPGSDDESTPTGDDGGLNQGFAEELPTIVEPAAVPEKSTAHDREATSWF